MNDLSLENCIGKTHLKKNLHSKDRVKLNKIIKSIYNNLDSKKNAFHFLSKNFFLDLNKHNLKKFIKYKTIVLIGMGGSILGSRAIYSFLKKKIKKNLIFIDNLDQLKIEKIRKQKNIKKSLFIIISKSGNTIETLINSSLLKDKISYKNTIIITEKKNNLLNTFAKKKKHIINTS